MDLPWKPDADKARERVEAWWNGEIIDRVCIKITAPLVQAAPGPRPKPAEPPKDLERHWFDPEVVIPRWEAYLPRVWYGGEAFPIMYPVAISFPAIPAAYLGCPITYVGTSNIWCEEIIGDWDHCPPLRFDPENKWYKKSVELFRAAGRSSKGRYFIGVPDLNGPGEVLARLRGSENLATDLFDHPDKVHEAMAKINPLWYEYWKSLTGVIHEYVEGYFFWMDIWSDTPATDLQCDFSIMISNEMFREFFLPHLDEQTRLIGRTVYHLDGPGALRHLDSLLELPKLSAIQWVPGAGAAPMGEWIPLLKRIQDAGKLQFIECRDDEVKPILEALRPEGIFLKTSSKTLERGQEILKLAEKMTARR